MIHHKVMIFLLVLIIIGLILTITGGVTNTKIAENKIDEICRIIYKTDKIFPSETLKPIDANTNIDAFLKKKHDMCFEIVSQDNKLYEESCKLLPPAITNDFRNEENSIIGVIVSGALLLSVPLIIFLIYGYVHRKPLVFYVEREVHTAIESAKKIEF